MRCVIQRVSEAVVSVDGREVSRIGKGLLVLVGFKADDSHDQIKWMAKKISVLRVFNDPDGKMNLSVEDIDGEILVVSQFTLYGELKKGTRPSYSKAAPPNVAEKLYYDFINALEESTKCPVKTGIFRAYMQVSLINDGPVTIILER
ncbi:MAG: D-tyrosyl-tRNA(Tyr) deacylase [Chlorobi bacterium]|nr:D-tyrosyl-tRNA(Tyr) deacylase [Chlorobiota bacterium]